MKAAIALVVLLVASGAARAQTTTSQCWAEGTTITCQTSPQAGTPGQYGYLHDAGRSEAVAVGSDLGQLLFAKQAKRPVDLVIGTKCGKYEFATVTYSDKSGNTVTMQGAVNTADLAAAKAKYPILRVVDLTCDE